MRAARTAASLPHRILLGVAACLAAAGAPAEKADRSQPMTVEADQPGSVDLQRQVLVFSGNVVVRQGTMVVRADRIELRERPDGYRAGTATGSPGQPATFRQKRDGVDETVEASADRIEFDGQTDVVRLIGNAAVRRLRGGALADEITGSLITWDNTRELFTVTGGSVSPDNPSGRVRAVLTPAPQASAPAGGASARPAAAASAPLHRPGRSGDGVPNASPGRSEPILKPSPAIGVPR
jgi:lipopolysaccharide export system protein LptA